MKEITRPRTHRLSTLAVMLGFAVAAGSGVAVAADKVTRVGTPAGVHAPAGALATQILDRWAPVVAALGQDATVWREMLAVQFALFGEANLTRLAAVAVTDNAAQSYARFTQAYKDAAMQAYMQSESAKVNPKLNTSTHDLVYDPIVPCRVVDTRNAGGGGPISFGTARNFYYYTNNGAFNWGTNQGGEPGAASVVCPGTFYSDNAPQNGAAAITVTVINPTAAGNAVAWGGASPVPTSSVLNWSAGQILANTTIIPGGRRVGAGPGGGVLDFAIYYNGPSGQAQFTADVVGYFVRNEATPLSCVNLLNPTPLSVAANSAGCQDPPACPAGYTQTAPAFDNVSCCNGLVVAQLNFNAAAGTAICAYNTTASAKSFAAGSICCRVPGR